MPTMYIIRGLPGAGKSTLAERLTPGRVFSADDYPGLYVQGQLNPKLLSEAHVDCQERCRKAMTGQDVSAANTFSCNWEMDRYISLCLVKGYHCMVLLAEGTTTPEGSPTVSIHNVPPEATARMEERWESFKAPGRPLL